MAPDEIENELEIISDTADGGYVITQFGCTASENEGPHDCPLGRGCVELRGGEMRACPMLRVRIASFGIRWAATIEQIEETEEEGRHGPADRRHD